MIKLKIALLFLFAVSMQAQGIIPLDTLNWEINAKAYVIENYKGNQSIYLQAGSIKLKNTQFLNGTIEYDIFLKEEQAFPGVYFRVNDSDGEQWFIRPHLSGKPDANQAAPIVNGITPWQLYFGAKYSFQYDYNYNDWTHVKIIVDDGRAQVFLNHALEPNLSWNLFHEPLRGDIIFSGGRNSGFHLANIIVDMNQSNIENFDPIKREPIDGLIESWEVSDIFEEHLLVNPNTIDSLNQTRSWQGTIKIEEGVAANISRKVLLYNGTTGNTVFAKTIIESDQDQLKYFEFGYSDRVVAILNGEPIYKGTNRWRSRDYRYLGTVGLFDGIYLSLKKGKNELLMAVSEDFGGWLITGRIMDKNGIKIGER